MYAKSNIETRGWSCRWRTQGCENADWNEDIEALEADVLDKDELNADVADSYEDARHFAKTCATYSASALFVTLSTVSTPETTLQAEW